MKRILVVTVATYAASALSALVTSWACRRLGMSPWAALGVMVPCNTLAAWIVLRRFRR